MQKQFILPGISCDECNGELALHIETKRISVSELKIKCTQCGWEQDILKKGSEKYEASKKRLKQISKELSKTIVKLRDTLPKNKEELGEVVTNPKHPFTSALLAGLVILMMELSGFSIFIAVTWILGNLILNPVGWVLIPVVVAIAFVYRNHFNREKLATLKTKLSELEQEREAGNLTEEEFEVAKEELFAGHFN